MSISRKMSSLSSSRVGSTSSHTNVYGCGATGCEGKVGRGIGRAQRVRVNHATRAWQGGRALGLVHHIEHRSCWTVANYCYLQDLYVAEDARGAGIGRALIEYVYRLARDRRFNRVHWLTHETNLTGMQLYDRIADKTGFVQYRKMMI